MNTTANSNQPPVDRYCDLIMKGGITSGVVYPVAINRLSRKYRFKSIGGTSAGAIAAAVTAAAEYQRRNNDSSSGFERLARLPDELGQDIPEAGARRLLSLFQPQDGTHRLFSVLVNVLNSRSTSSRIGNIVLGLLKAYWPAALLSALIAVAVGYLFAAWLASLLLGVILVFVSVGMWLYRDVAGPLVVNGFGMCNGMPGKASRTEAITPWLHRLIQEAAGRPNGAPLTFGDLWRPKGATETPKAPGEDAIVLKMFSTNLAHGRPYVFPLNELVDNADRETSFRSSERLFFNPDELRPYLPQDVHKWLVDHARNYTAEPHRKGKDPSDARAKALGLMELPPPHEFPILLAARMSLSFPLLFSAVPLWAINYDLPPGRRDFHRCWFSDGGVSSNFPMHLFDGLVPRWPTFGITLEPEIEGRLNMIYLPQSYREGYGERWDLFDNKVDGIGRFGGFIGALVSTMQNWSDNSLSRMPGFRDRVVRLRLKPNEGGMNLNMEPENIEAMATRGAEAAEALLARFSNASESCAQATGWDEHRLVRLNVLLKMVEARAAGVVHALSPQCPHATPIETLIDAMLGTNAPGYEYPLASEQVQNLRDLINTLHSQMATLDKISHRPNPNPFVPLPSPELRVRPPL
ncbi:patatin-like phospholipase family protein [Hydrogenophaga sp.]|uniref:patatin-like phospholipase family protein n=1 Tax=Hydrogenophaga sp. TaxID=1904254 RepID=UPI0025C5452F|nr:patatin-like phospholipase family protein [Hydrogenophaga sp.]MBT9465523.1 patatin-like phospholipase family protein [Hydrogenophaga sp.]